MKTVTVFSGSGRKRRGLTYRAARQFLDNLESHGDVRGEIVFLSDHELGLCRGCKVCFERGVARVSLPVLPLHAAVRAMSEVLREVARTGGFVRMCAGDRLATPDEAAALVSLGR